MASYEMQVSCGIIIKDCMIKHMGSMNGAIGDYISYTYHKHLQST